MKTLFLILKIIFAVCYSSVLAYMANSFLKKSSWNAFYKLSGSLAVVGLIMTTQVFVARGYTYFKMGEDSTLNVMGISRMVFVLFFVIVSIFSYYMYIVRFNKKKYQAQQNLVWILSLLSIILAVLPQNDYAKEVPGLLLPHLRVIPSFILGVYVSLILLLDGYFKRIASFQHYALGLFVLNLINLSYSFFIKARAAREYSIFALTAIVFLSMIAVFHNELSKKNFIEKF